MCGSTIMNASQNLSEETSGLTLDLAEREGVIVRLGDGSKRLNRDQFYSYPRLAEYAAHMATQKIAIFLSKNIQPATVIVAPPGDLFLAGNVALELTNSFRAVGVRRFEMGIEDDFVHRRHVAPQEVASRDVILVMASLDGDRELVGMLDALRDAKANVIAVVALVDFCDIEVRNHIAEVSMCEVIHLGAMRPEPEKGAQ